MEEVYKRASGTVEQKLFDTLNYTCLQPPDKSLSCPANTCYSSTDGGGCTELIVTNGGRYPPCKTGYTENSDGVCATPPVKNNNTST